MRARGCFPPDFWAAYRFECQKFKERLSQNSCCRKELFVRMLVITKYIFRDHAKELGNKVESSPIIFIKPSSCIIEEGEQIKLPNGATEVHHEVELGLVIGKSLTQVHSAILGYVIALDLTDRLLQKQLCSNGLPWTMAKCFDTACPVGSILPLESLPVGFLTSRQEFQKINSEIWLRVNKIERQRSKLNMMIWTPADLVSIITRRISLEYGDLVLTGTPAGVGPLKSGDEVEASLDSLCPIRFGVK
ncbi:Acylpyruvase FAHD1, mitochondrial [Schistosoma japonicum]|nr:Acylpyruvase FAHD1, mitochondrial [Schistosoma japonicum]